MAVDVSDAPLDDRTQQQVRELAASLDRAYGAPPLSDQALSRLRAGAPVRHLVARADGSVVGYAQVDGTSLEVAADGAAVGALVDAASDGGELLAWSHGHRSPIAPVLAERGFRRARILHQMRRRLETPPTPEALPEGVRVRAFVPGQDETAWLTVNAAAFADHAEQGAWTSADLLAREAAPWFDPRGFLLAERGSELLGFHWTKIHPQPPDAPSDERVGEVYVLGVAPAAQGLRLGSALLDRGLVHLWEQGCRDVLLYVDDENRTAVHLYERAGFTIADSDVQWRRAGADADRV